MSLSPPRSGSPARERPEVVARLPIAATGRSRTSRRSRGPRVAWGMVALACVAIAAGSLAVQSAANFDPWGWIVWGREVLHLDLNTLSGPSWKPGPVVFTTVFAVFGGIAPSLWLVAARLGALLAVVMAYRIAARLGGLVAGLIAAVLLLVTQHFLRDALYGQSDPLMVGLLLSGIDRALSGRQRAAMALFVLASLMRPEIWLILAAYSVYVWRRSAADRPWIIVASGVFVLGWFGGAWWGSGDPLIASTMAKQFVIGNRWDQYATPALAMFKLDGHLLHPVVIVLALAGVAIAGWRRDWVVLGLAAIAVLLLVSVAAMAQDGYPVLDRFLFASAALVFIVSGIGFGYIVRVARSAHIVAAVAAAAIVAALLSPHVVNTARAWTPEVKTAQNWSEQLAGMRQAIAAAGGRARILACPGLITSYYLMKPALAWDLDTSMPRLFRASPYASSVVFTHGGVAGTRRHSRKPARITTLGTTGDWNVFYVTHPPARASC